jgi:hypothetical protein
MPIEKAGSFYLLRGTPDQFYDGIKDLERETTEKGQLFDGHIYKAPKYGQGNIIASDGRGNLAFLRVYISSDAAVFRGRNSVFSPHELSVISRLDELINPRET